MNDVPAVGAGPGAVDWRHWTGSLRRSPDVGFLRLAWKAMVLFGEASFGV